MAIRKLSSDVGADLYHDGTSPNFTELEADGRNREVFDPNDWTPGDYTYAEIQGVLYLTGTGEKLWEWDGNY